MRSPVGGWPEKAFGRAYVEQLIEIDPLEPFMQAVAGPEFWQLVRAWPLVTGALLAPVVVAVVGEPGLHPGAESALPDASLGDLGLGAPERDPDCMHPVVFRGVDEQFRDSSFPPARWPGAHPWGDPTTRRGCGIAPPSWSPSPFPIPNSRTSV